MFCVAADTAVPEREVTSNEPSNKVHQRMQGCGYCYLFGKIYETVTPNVLPLSSTTGLCFWKKYSKEWLWRHTCSRIYGGTRLTYQVNVLSLSLLPLAVIQIDHPCSDLCLHVKQNVIATELRYLGLKC